MDVQKVKTEAVAVGNTAGSSAEDQYGGGFNACLDKASEKELQALKIWLFSENIRVQAEQKKLLEMENRLLKERMQFQEEMKILNQKVTASRQRLKQDEQFFEKKMEILKEGFSNLEADRKAFEREKETFLRNSRETETSAEEKGIFFAGVRNQLALKKRYKDLLKIYHPDNLAGDKEIMQRIGKEYEAFRKVF